MQMFLIKSDDLNEQEQQRGGEGSKENEGELKNDIIKDLTERK